MSKKTPFETAQQQAKEGKLKTPIVGHGANTIDYFGYQISVHKYNLGLMAIGMKFKAIKFSDIKKYYGLKGRSAKDCLPQLTQMAEDYKNGLKTNPIG